MYGGRLALYKAETLGCIAQTKQGCAVFRGRNKNHAIERRYLLIIARFILDILTLSKMPNSRVKMRKDFIGGEMTDDPVNHPKHYTQHPSGIECIQVTEYMGFNLGNAVKYIWRADLKNDALEDLKKARWY